MSNVKNEVVYARHSGVSRGDRLSIPLIKRCIRAAARCEGVDVPFEVSVLVTNDEGIRALNSEFRNTDSPTDVLSFPMHDIVPAEVQEPAGVTRSKRESGNAGLPGKGGEAGSFSALADPNTGVLQLGDIVMSAERVIEQAGRFGHSTQYETAYLTVHSVLHLLGYDHIDEAEQKKRMRTREKEIMSRIEEQESEW